MTLVHWQSRPLTFRMIWKAWLSWFLALFAIGFAVVFLSVLIRWMAFVVSGQ